jgi:hypothetical protein
VLSALQLLEQTPLKRFGSYYQNSHLSEVLPDVRTSTKKSRKRIEKFEYALPEEHIPEKGYSYRFISLIAFLSA